MKKLLNNPIVGKQIRLVRDGIIVGRCIMKVGANSILVRPKFVPVSDPILYDLNYVEPVPEECIIPWLW